MRSFPTVFVFYLLLVTAAFAQDGGIWSKRIEDDARRETFTLTARKPNYVLVTHMEAPNQTPFEFAGPDFKLHNEELKYQLSLQTKMADDLFGGNGDLWFGYTQVSWWQKLNSAVSSPFRETNYEPEVYFSWLTSYDLAGFRLRTVN